MNTAEIDCYITRREINEDRLKKVLKEENKSIDCKVGDISNSSSFSSAL
jgi:hypothetical protein